MHDVDNKIDMQEIVLQCHIKRRKKLLTLKRFKTRKKVVLIGTSNLKYINTSMMSNHKVEVENEIEYTLKEGQEYVDSMKTNGKIVDVLIENDITDETPKHCSEKVNNVCIDLQKKSKDSKVILSMGISRAWEANNQKISKLNVILQDKLGDLKMSLYVAGDTFLSGATSKMSSGPRWKTSLTIGNNEVGCASKSAILTVLHESTEQSNNSPTLLLSLVCICLFVCPSACLCVCVCVSVCLSVCFSACLSVFLSMCLSVYVSLCLYVCPCECLSVCHYVLRIYVCCLYCHKCL